MKFFLILFVFLLSNLALATSEPSATAEIVRASLASAQTELVFDAESARNLVLTDRKSVV